MSCNPGQFFKEFELFLKLMPYCKNTDGVNNFDVHVLASRMPRIPLPPMLLGASFFSATLRVMTLIFWLSCSYYPLYALQIVSSPSDDTKALCQNRN